MTRPRGFAVWNPQGKTRALLVQIETILAEYENYLPLTIRQVFYRLVGKFGYDKTEKAYGRLCETFNRARRAGLIPFEAIPVFYRLAVTHEQIDRLSLPTAPPKKTDSRSFEADFTVQCEAILPDVLTSILREAIEARQCLNIRADVLAQEQQDRIKLMDWIGH